ncbi:MAG TPA: DUF881 domain-containing protein [Anaerolineae bacterium]|nr:DUF881 domain-containing protein [Anaerolineae bacterium]
MTRFRRKPGNNLALLAAGLTVGLLLATSWQAPAGTRAVEVNDREERIFLSIERLEDEQQDLRETLGALRSELSDRQRSAEAETDRLESLRTELDRQQLLAGLIEVHGPGVRVILDDSAAHPPPGADAGPYLIHEQDLRDIVNLLWMAGSEAIAINDERLVASSSIYCVGSTVMVNSTRLSPPYAIRAIGSQRVQQDYLRNPSYLQTLKEKKRSYGLRFDVDAQASLVLPAYRGGFLTQYARPGE